MPLYLELFVLSVLVAMPFAVQFRATTSRRAYLRWRIASASTVLGLLLSLLFIFLDLGTGTLDAIAMILFL